MAAKDDSSEGKSSAAPVPKDAHFSHTKTIVKAAGIFFLAVLFSKVANYAFRWVGTRLGPSEYGVFSLAFAVFDVCTQLAVLGMDQAVLRFLPEEQALGRKSAAYNTAWYSFKVVIFSGLAALAVLFLSAPLLSDFFHEPRLANAIYALAPAVPLTVLCAVLVVVARSFKHVEYEACAKHFGESLFRPILAGLAVFLGLGATGISLAVSASATIACILLLYFVSRLLPGNWVEGVRNATAPKGMLSFSAPIYLSVIAGLVITWGSVFAVGKLLSAREVGILNAAIPVATFVQIPSIAIPVLFGTIAIELKALSDRKSVERLYKNITKAIVMFTLPIALVLSIFARQLLEVLFGPDYSVGANALIVLSLGYFLLATGSTAISMLLVEKRPKFFALVAVASAATFLVGLFVLIPIRAFFGAALANGIALSMQGLLPIAAVYYVSRMHPFSETFWRTVASAVLAGVVAFAVQLALPLPSLASLVVGGSIFVVAYAAFLFLLRSFDQDDLELFKAIERRTGVDLGALRSLLKGYYFKKG